MDNEEASSDEVFEEEWIYDDDSSTDESQDEGVYLCLLVLLDVVGVYVEEAD